MSNKAKGSVQLDISEDGRNITVHIEFGAGKTMTVGQVEKGIIKCCAQAIEVLRQEAEKWPEDRKEPIGH